MIKKFIAIILGFGMLFSVVYAKEMVDSPHIYDFEDSAGTLWDKLPGDGATAQWRGYVTNSALETLIDSSVTDQKQGRYVSVFPSKSEHVIQHNFKPEWFMKDGKIEKIAFSFAVNFKNPDRLRQIYIYDENGKTATQLFEAKNNNGKVSMAYVGKWQTGVDEEGNPIFETDKSGNVIDRGVRYIEWNGVKNDWYYINYLIDIPSHSYQMRIIRKDGSISGGSINYGEHGVLHGNFKGAPSKIEFKTTAGRNGGEEAFLDDITFGGYSGELGIFGAKEVVPESKEISLKFANGFNSTGQPTRDKIKIMQTKVGDTKDIKNFEVENSPNSVKIKFAGDLESCADYKILFDESVKTVFGQEVSDYTFKTTGKKG
ncbi:MAG: hypothetical protein RR145_04140, partial [Oscillospiraceae bacterium]